MTVQSRHLLGNGVAQLKRFIIGLVAGDQSSSSTGEIWYNTVANKLKWYDGTSIIDPIDRASHTGTQLASTISDLAATTQANLVGGDVTGTVSNIQYGAGSIVNADVSASANIAYSKLSLNASITSSDIVDGAIVNADISPAAAIAFSKLAAPLGSFSMGSQKITNLAIPLADTDATNKSYVDNMVTGLSWKAPVYLASTANINLASAPATIDGITIGIVGVDGVGILVKDQTTGSQNGIYLYFGSGLAMTRRLDADTTNELSSAAVFVQSGTVNADKAFVQTIDAPVVGTTTLTWVQFGGGTIYTASNGILLTGSNFTSVADPTPATITVAAAGISVDTSKIARWKTGLIGNGSSTALVITHSLQQYVSVQLFDASTNEKIDADIVLTNSTTCTVTFLVAPATNGIRYVVVG